MCCRLLERLPGMAHFIRLYAVILGQEARPFTNGDVQAFSYDDLYRLTAASRIPAVGSDNPAWALASVYDENGNRTELQSGGPRWGDAVYGTDRWGLDVPGSSAIFGQAIFGSARFGEVGSLSPATIWSVPPPGFDSMDRMPGFVSSDDQAVQFEYDPEGRRKRILYPNGTITEATYDIVGRLLRLRTTREETELLDLVYGYSQASDRIAMKAGDDTWEYGLDAAGRLVRESLNRFVESDVGSFQQGALNATEIDFTTGRVALLRFSDSFSGSDLNVDRWRIAMGRDTLYGAELRQSDGLHFVSPRGFTNQLWFQHVVNDGYGLSFSQQRATFVEHRWPLNGDFDVQVDFSDWQCVGGTGGSANFRFNLQLVAEPVERGQNYVYVAKAIASDTSRYEARVGVSGTTVLDVQTGSVPDIQGKLRLVRAGSVVTMGYWDEVGADWAWPASFTYPNFTANPLYVSLAHAGYGYSLGCVRATDFQYGDPGQGDYVGQGTYTSAIYDAGRDDVEWGNISWDETLPAGCDVTLQVAVASSPEGPYDFVGPDGTDATFFTTPGGEALDSGTVGRYCRYRAFLSGDTFASPSFGNVHISHDGLNESRVTFWEYDPAGNRTRQTRTTDAGTETEVTDDAGWPAEDRINELNQIRRRDVITGAGTVTWRYGWDADGNQVSKTDGTDTWTRVFDEDNRLLSESKNGALQVSFSYDSLGRMLTRTGYIDGEAEVPTKFRWDGWDMVEESAPDTTLTRYFCPQGVLHSFERAGASFDCHSDALGSVRLITDSSGNVVSHFEYSAWGEAMASSFDGVPGGFPYRFVGALGVRWDEKSGMYFMRQRWYALEGSRFISRDPVHSQNRYTYALNSPLNHVDPYGLQPNTGGRAIPMEYYTYPNSVAGWYIPYARQPGRDHDVWIPRNNPPAMNPNYYDQSGPVLGLTEVGDSGTTLKAVWDTLTKGTDCQKDKNKKCFLVCTRNISPSYGRGTWYRHAFLVFGSTSDRVYGLWQGDQIFRSDVKITNWNFDDFQYSGGLAVKCRVYCGDKSAVQQAEAIAKRGIPSGYRYIVGESNAWVKLVLDMAGIPNWKGYDIVLPAP